MMRITEVAIQRLKTIMQQQNITDYGLRIGVRQTNQCYSDFFMGFQKNPSHNDIVFQKSGIKIYIDKNNKSRLFSIEVDYIEELGGSGFVFRDYGLDMQNKCLDCSSS